MRSVGRLRGVVIALHLEPFREIDESVEQRRAIIVDQFDVASLSVFGATFKKVRRLTKIEPKFDPIL